MKLTFNLYFSPHNLQTGSNMCPSMTLISKYLLHKNVRPSWQTSFLFLFRPLDQRQNVFLTGVLSAFQAGGSQEGVRSGL
jgi:hypothetical protein